MRKSVMGFGWAVPGIAAALLCSGCGSENASDDKATPATRLYASTFQADLAGVYAVDGYRINFNLVNENGKVTVTDQGNPSNARIYQNPKLIKFLDKWVSFDLDGPAGQVYRLYQAAFDRKPDPAGIGFWIKANENGRDLTSIAGDFIASDEFKRLYGDNVDNATFIDRMYQNILHRVGESGGFNWWVGQLNAGVDRRTVLSSFAESAENKQKLLADMTNGFDAEPYSPGYYFVKPTSYANAKNLYVPQISKPGKSWYPVQAVADFTKTGKLDMIAAFQNYSPDSVSLAQVQTAAASGDTRYLSDIKYFSQSADGSWVEKASFSVKGCLHPRKAAVADFNGDGYPDVVIACTGYDADPNPGEYALLLTNDRSGGFKISNATPNPGYYHSVAAFDAHGNGFADLIVVDNTRRPNVYVLRNQKDGTFKEDFSAVNGLNDQIFRYFSVEVVDVNQDGLLDMIVGGNENLNPTEILYGDKLGQFGAGGNVTILPGVSQRAVVLDFVLIGKTLFVGRTSDAKSTVGYYNTQTLQKIDLRTMQSNVLLDNASTNQANWIFWWIPTMKNGLVGVTPYATVDNGGNNVSSYFFAP